MEKINRSEIAAVLAGGHFDSEWYSKAYPDVAILGMSPVEHYIWIGWRLQRRPSKRMNFQFDADNYLAANPDVAQSGIRPISHYLACGINEGRSLGDAPTTGAIKAKPRSAEDLKMDADLIRKSPLFDPQWYASRYLNNATDETDPLTHFLHYENLGNDPSPYFASAWYLQNWSDVRQAGISPLAHYLREGYFDARSPHPAFDVDWYQRRYLANSPDVEPVSHYLTIGHALDHQPHAFFNSDYYLDIYKDLHGSSVNPYIHWIKHGRAEGRQGLDPTTLGNSLKVGVVAHIFYEDLWPQISARLHTIPIPFDLIVTVSPGSQLADAVRADWPDADVIETPNSGRDIGPFLRVQGLIRERGYDVVCKLHTKRGATEPETWRHMLLEGVLGSRDQVRQILGWFEHDRDLAAVGLDQLYLNGPRFIGPNSTVLRDLFRRSEGRAAPMPEEWGFFAGSMFWIRPKLLDGIIDANLLDLFEEDNRSYDGQTAHAIERLFGLIAASRGCRIGLTSISGARATTAVNVQRAAHRTVLHELAATLPVKTRELALHVPSLRRSKRRAWLAPPDSKPGITFVGPVEAVNGLGVSARGYVDAAIATGLPVHVIKWRPGFDRVRMRNVDVPTPGEQIINIVHLNLDLIYSARLLDQAPLDRLLSPSHYNIVIVLWEVLAVNPEWVETIHRFDEIWASSTYMVRAMQSVAAIPARVVRPALNIEQRTTAPSLPFDLPSDRTIFFYAADFGSVAKRKNPEAFWRAYVGEFASDDGAFCLIKLHYADPTHPLVKEITALAKSRCDMLLITDSMSDSEMEALFDRIDCYVSPHRAEGLGLTLLEAMFAGKPVIATGHSGEGDFVREDTALPVDYDLIEVGEGAEPYMPGAVWADPKLASLQKRMRQVVDDHEEARTIGARGRERAIELFSLEQTSAQLKDELTRIWRAGGGSVQDFMPSSDFIAN